MKILVAVNNL